ncbi:MAG: TadE/TadG family type IV pilus assembly protein [Acidimicrobiia bacterium]
MRKRTEERGATIVEAALALPILILVIVAILELGLVFKDYLTVSYLSREGARIGALAGNDPEADCAILRGLGEIATPSDLARINTVQIYKADNSTGAQGATNTATYQVGQDPTLCSVPAQPSDGWTVNSSAYPPLGRNVTVGPSSQLDIIGVRITLDRSWVTNFPPFSGAMQVNETTITRLEPGVFE